MKKTVFSLILAAAALLPVSAEDILLKDDSTIAEADVLGKDQFGIIVKVKKDPQTGKHLRKFVSFYEMNPISLNKFAFCDTKTIERIYMAVQDRAALAQNKFAPRIAEYKDKKDYAEMLQIHSGVSVYKVMFAAYQPTDTGLVGYLYSDTAEMQFYGIVFLYGLLGDGDEVYVGNAYPTSENKEINGITYPVFTVINPEGDDLKGVVFSENSANAPKRLPPGGKPGADGTEVMPPPPGADGKMMPPPGGDGKMMPPPGGDGKMMPPPQDGDGKGQPREPKGNRKGGNGPKRGGPGEQPSGNHPAGGGGPGGGAGPGGGGGGMPPPPMPH